MTTTPANARRALFTDARQADIFSRAKMEAGSVTKVSVEHLEAGKFYAIYYWTAE